MKKFKYAYHISYSWFKKSEGNGMGAITLYRTTPMNTEDEIEEARKFIATEHSFDTVVILNFIKIKVRKGKQ